MVLILNILDECDAEYVVKISLSDSVFYEKGKNKSNNTWGLRVIRKITRTSKNIRVLFQHRLISRWEMFRAISSLGNSPLIMCVASVGGLFGSLGLYFLPIPIMLATSLLSFALFVFAAALEGSKSKFLAELFDRANKKLAHSNERRIELPWKEQELYEFAKALSEKDSQEDVKKQLFDVLSKYPTETNEKINELFKMKEAVPKNIEEGQIVLSDVDEMIDKLFDIRDTSSSGADAQVRQIMHDAIKKEKMENMGISVEKLSEIADFVNNLEAENKTLNFTRDNLEVSTMVNEMNDANIDYEKVHEPNFIKKRTSRQ